MTSLRILGQKKVDTVKKVVKAALGVDIKVYDETGAEASGAVTIGSIRTKKPEQVEVRVVGQTLIKNLIKFFGNNYGIKVEILSGDGTAADVNATLGAVQKTYMLKGNLGEQGSPLMSRTHIESEPSSIRVCCVRAGWMLNLEGWHNCIGLECLENEVFLYVMFSDDEQAIGYALDRGDGSFMVESCPPGDVDTLALRRALPEPLAKVWNSILLGSLDLDEIDEEGVEYRLYHRDDEADDPTSPFDVSPDFEDAADFHGLLAVHKVFGELVLGGNFESLASVAALRDGAIDAPIVVPASSIGDVLDFETETETLCVFL
jgi:hypothetical protein